jgi:Ni/Fe-hydrogenase subunit HybB-like protein
MILAFLFTVSLHLLLGLLSPALDRDDQTLLIIDAVTLVVLVAVEQFTLVIAGRVHRHLLTPLPDLSRSAS